MFCLLSTIYLRLEKQRIHQMTKEHLCGVRTELPSLCWLLCSCQMLPVQIYNLCEGF